jgi:hypothetical protein
MEMKTQNITEVNSGFHFISRDFYHRHLFWVVLFLCGLMLLTPIMARAETLISEGYLTSSALSTGSIVSLTKNSTDHVISADTSNAINILGVVVGNDSSQLSLSSSQNNQVQVATNGLEQVLVSDINGNISTGDAITASPIAGFGMKATSNTKVVGIAQDNFPNSTVKEVSYTDHSGHNQKVNLGQTAVLINVSYYYRQPDKTIIPAALQKLANALAGKTVNSVPIILSIVIFIVAIVTVVSIIYAMIHSSIISVGRNPLSQAAVYRNVIQLSGLVIGILGASVVSIYLILTRL